MQIVPAAQRLYFLLAAIAIYPGERGYRWSEDNKKTL
jgi:hypothetical protein